MLQEHDMGTGYAGPASEMTDDAATVRMKRYCRETLNADLVGVANIERCANAPTRMSPQGIMPSARSVIVMAVHHPDACIELGGRSHPQDIGPYRVQYRMNQRLDEMSFRLAGYLQRLGHEAVGILSSNSWRYRGYRDLSEQFAPDISHMHMACAAGLAEFGYSGLAMSPEFGPRNRWVSVITDAVFTPTPLIEPGSVCDGCMLCRKHCMSAALATEIDGWNEVHIEDKVYRYAKKNLWRCAWGEHFDLDLDLDLPEKVTPETIENAIATHGLRGGEMGSCLRYCLPPARRRFQREYSDAPRRNRDVTCGDAANPNRSLQDRLNALADARGADGVVVSELAEGEMDAFLPGARRGLSVVVRLPASTVTQADDIVDRILTQTAYDLTRELERNGYDAICETDHKEGRFQRLINADGRKIATQTVLTTCPLQPTPLRIAPPRTVSPLTTEALMAEAGEAVEGLLHGVADATDLDAVADQLATHWEGERELVVEDRVGWENRFGPMDPVVTERPVEVTAPGAVLPGARSVLVLGLPLHREAVACTGRSPAEAPGPMALQQYESQVLLRFAAWRVVRTLESAGHRACVTSDLLGTGSLTGNPRGPQPDAFCNRFAATAAGLAHLGRCGQPIHPEHGSNIRTISIVTDTPLPASGPLCDEHRPACEDCSLCVDRCPVGAFAETVSVDIAGRRETFRRIDRRRCDWAKRYSLVAESGTACLGWDLTIEPPEQITPEDLADALRQLPGIERHRPCNAELCVLACPYTR
ncbi:MAG: hypothetical protein ACP5HU_11865 [Phycisphaerae bacterium]